MSTAPPEPEVLDRVAAAVAAAVPGLAAGRARSLAAEAAAGPRPLRQLDRHLAARPDALSSGDPDAPLPLIRLAGLLEKAGCAGVAVPGCSRCGKRAALRHRAEGGRLCDPCYRGGRREPCAGCGRDRAVHKRGSQGPLCATCSHLREECTSCGLARPVAARRADGSPFCETCRPARGEACASCGDPGLQRPAGQRAAAGKPDLCARCSRRILADCALCGQRRRCSRRWSRPVCEPCRRAGRRPEPPPRKRRPPSDPGAERARRAARARRVLPGRVTALLADPVRGIPPQLEPLAAALASAPNPGSALDWVARRSGARLLAGLAARAHDEPLTHGMLDACEQTQALHHVRQVLVHSGVLPERAEDLDRLGPWLSDLLADCPPAHAGVIRPFATWHVLRRARARARRQGFTPASASWARSHILVAVQFLAWLDGRGTVLADAAQPDIDAWLDGATQHRYLVRAFTEWAVARRLASGITVPSLPHTEPASFPGEDARWHLLQRCLDDSTLPADVRAAGALLLLYGQFTSTLTRMTADDVTRDANGPCLRIGTTLVPLPPKVEAVLLAQLRSQPAQANYHQPADGTRPLFPGRRHGQPVRASTLARRLRTHGIAPRQSRNAALAGWASELPAPVLADILGLHVNTTEQWAQRTRRDWTSYIAERAARPSPQQANPPETDSR